MMMSKDNTGKFTVNGSLTLQNGESFCGVTINDETRSLIKDFLVQKGAQVTEGAQKQLLVDRGWYAAITSTAISFTDQELQAFVSAKLPSQAVQVAAASNKSVKSTWSQELYSRAQDTARAAGSLRDTLVSNRVSIATHTAAFALGVASLAVTTKVVAKLQAAKSQPTFSLSLD